MQLSDQVVYLPYDIKSETLVTNVTVTGRLESLVQPLLFYMENVTQQQLSRSESKRKRRGIDDFCEGAGTVKPMSYFCVHRLTGGIEVTDDFQFKNGDEFDVKFASQTAISGEKLKTLPRSDLFHATFVGISEQFMT